MASKVAAVRETAGGPMSTRGMVGKLTETPRGDGVGWGFTVGIRFQTTLAYATETEALKARERMLEVLRGAEISERWARR